MKCILTYILNSGPAKVLTAMLLGLCISLGANAQSNASGTVIDENGEPVTGASVVVVGTKTHAITDLDGNFSIPAKSGQSLEILFLGKKTLQVSVPASGRLGKLVLEEDRTQLDESVVVGYGVQKKSSLTSAVSAIKGEELLTAPATNVTQILGGKLPGISSVQTSGEPGLDQASLRIRGSVYSVQYVVDGFPVDNINNLDPNDIESVSVLKDGASAAVYGLSASGGVIIVTTKSGAQGKTKVTYNASFGASMNTNFPEFMDGPEFAYYYNLAQMMDQLANGTIATAGEYQPYFTSEQVKLMTNGDPTDGWDNVDYVNKVFGTGFTQKHSVTVQGGKDKTRYFASFGYMGQKGNIDNFTYKRYNVRTNIDTDFAKHFHFKVGLSGVVSRRQTPGYNSGGSDASGGEAGYLSVARQTIQMHPYMPEKYDGLYTATIQKNTQGAQSPLAAIYESGYRKTNGVSLSTNFSLSYDFPFIEGLQAKVSGSYDYSTSYNKNLDTPYSVNVLAKDTATGEWGYTETADPRLNASTGISIGEGQTQYQQMVGQGGLYYAHSFGKHNVDAMALLEVRDYQNNSLAAYGKNLPFAALPELSYSTPTDNPISGYSNASRSAGYVFRLKYDYDSKYLAEFTGRYDGSYKFFGMNSTRWGFFPSASVAWRISKEDFMSNVTFLDDLKIRASVGLLGNDSVSPYMFLATLSDAGGVVYNGVYNTSYAPNGVANTDLTWEKTLSWNYGFDATLWNGLLGFEVDGFYNYTYDLLTYQSSGFPDSMGGYYPTYVNANSLDTRGIDILVSHKNHFNLAGKPFWYGVAASVTYSKTRWLEYQDSPNIYDWKKVSGKTYGSIYCWKADGLYTSEEEIDNSAWYGTRPNVGDIKYVDLNGDGKIDWDDKGYFGRSNRPELTFGLNLNFQWNGFDFNAQFTGGALFDVSLTGTYYNYNDDNTVWTMTFKENANSPLYLVQNAYSIYNTDATFPRITLGNTGTGGDNGLSSTFWIRDGKYVRLKSAQLGYTIPSKWSNKIGIEAFRIFVEGQNLFTIDGLPEGIDPESPSVNNGYYPQQTYLMGGITLTF